MFDSPRIVVIGSSCAGKTTFASELARARGCPRIELDGLYWGADWTPKPQDEFLRLLAQAVEQTSWVADGNYSSARHVLWPRATTIVWLNYGLALVLWRGLRRTLARCLFGVELYHGNRESLRRSFASRESILLWIVTTFHRRRRDFSALRSSGKFANVTWHEVTSPAQARQLLATLQDKGAGALEPRLEGSP